MTTSRQAAKQPAFNLLQCQNLPIFDQLQLEEALLRADEGNWCLINRGTPPAIVMGISGQPEKFIDAHILAQNPVPVIKRFSGGGTVFVDANTTFVTWICNVHQLDVECCPVKIHAWTSQLYQDAFPMLGMKLRENDYVIGEHKWGGNAQYLCKGRWLHHTSMLWDYDPVAMRRLLQPQKMPAYRQNRSHDDFLCRLRDHLPSRTMLEESLISTLQTRFNITKVPLLDIQPILQRPHRKSVIINDFHDF